MNVTPPCIPCGANNQSNPTIFYRGKNQYIPLPYVYVDENNNIFEDPSLELLVARVTQFRHENGMAPIPYLAPVIESFTFLSDDKYAEFREAYVFKAETHLNMLQYLRGAAAYVKGALFGVELVGQAVAEKRGSRCLDCMYNQQVVNGRTKEDLNLAQSKFCQLRGERRVTMEPSLHICAKCTCVTGCKIWFSKKFIDEGTTQALKSELERSMLLISGKTGKCWITDDSIE